MRQLSIDYWVFARQNRRFIGYGALMCLLSGAGQTYLVGIFGPEIQRTFSLSYTQWGGLYLLGTLASALVLPWTGQLIDRFDLRIFAAAALSGLALACISISVAPSIIAVVLSIFLLRHFGQGLTFHAGATPMARYFNINRGKAIALATIGFSTGEALIPAIIVLLIAIIGWRDSYLLVGITVFCMIPLVLWLLRGQTERHQSFLDSLKAKQDGAQQGDYSRAQVLAETRFYLMLPAMLAPSFIITAMYFYHLTLAAEKGWSAAFITGSYWIFGLASILTLLISGPMIDRFTAKRLVPLFFLPMPLALLIIYTTDAALWVYPYLFLAGLCGGGVLTALPSLWAELYGAKNIGAIKSLMAALSVLSTSLAPVSLGLLLDADISMTTIYLIMAIGCVISVAFLIAGLRWQPSGAKALGV